MLDGREDKGGKAEYKVEEGCLDASGFIGLQIHSIPAEAGPYQVRWKNIRVRELKPGDKVD